MFAAAAVAAAAALTAISTTQTGEITASAQSSLNIGVLNSLLN